NSPTTPLQVYASVVSLMGMGLMKLLSGPHPQHNGRSKLPRICLGARAHPSSGREVRPGLRGARVRHENPAAGAKNSPCLLIPLRRSASYQTKDSARESAYTRLRTT